jgi:O-antigen ligase
MGKKSREKKDRQPVNETVGAPSQNYNMPDRFPVLKMFILGGAILAMFAPLIVAGSYFFPFVGGKSIYFMAFCEVMFFAWLALISFDKQYRPKKNIILIVLALFIAAMAVRTFGGVDPSRSFWSKHERMTGLLMWLHLFGFFLVTSSVFKVKDWLLVFIASNSAAVIVTFDALFSKDAATRGGGTLGNDSFLGTYLLLNLFIALYLFFFKFKDKSKFPEFFPKALKIFSIVVFSILSFCLLIEGTDFWTNFISGKAALVSLPDLLKDIMVKGARAAKYSFIGGLSLLGILYLVFEKTGKLRAFGRTLLAFGTLGVLTLFSMALQQGSPVYQEFAKLASKARMLIWGFSWQAFLEKPWFGWGPENFELAFSLHFDPRLFMPEYGGEVWFDRAHNIVVDNLVALGAIGSILYLAIFAAIFWVLWRSYFSKKINFAAAAIPSVALVAYFIQNLTVFDMVSSLMMFFMIISWTASLEREEAEPAGDNIENRYVQNSKYPFIVAIILILFLFSFFNFIVKPMKNGYFAVQAVKTEDQNDRVGLYWQTLDISPIGRYQEAEFFADWFSNFSLSSNADTMPAEDMKKEFVIVADIMKKSIKESPLDFRLYLKLGQLYNSWSRVDLSQADNAQNILEEAMKLDSDNQQTYWSLAQTKLIQGKPDEAVVLGDLAIKLEPRVKNSHFVAMRIAKMINNKELFEQKKSEALKINPGWQADIEASFPSQEVKVE